MTGPAHVSNLGGYVAVISFDIRNSFLNQSANTNSLPAGFAKNAALFAEAPQAAPATHDQVSLSAEAQTAGLRTDTQNLMLFGGDRKKAIGSLIASGAKAENPKLPWYKNLLRKVAGGKTKTDTKRISADQELHTKVKVKNFNVKGLRLTTHGKTEGNVEHLRHIDFDTHAPNGKNGQVKDIGQIIGKGQPTREFEQDVTHPDKGEPGRIKNSYYDPKTGKKFLQSSEVASDIQKDSFGAYRTKADRHSYRQIDTLNGEGKVDKRYVFDYGQKSFRLETLDAQGQVSNTQKLSKKTDYWKLLDSLTLNPPSAHAAPAQAPAHAPTSVAA